MTSNDTKAGGIAEKHAVAPCLRTGRGLKPTRIETNGHTMVCGVQYQQGINPEAPVVPTLCRGRFVLYGLLILDATDHGVAVGLDPRRFQSSPRPETGRNTNLRQ